ncbi:MAG TPA: hypothetical protein VGJ20_25545 [Xanthobacteraceae bacterium]|jgi:hypothetical protein
MRDNRHVRPYAPALLRVIIVMAVIAAVPVVLWAITAFVSSYVGPPRLPTFRPMAATSSTDGSAGLTVESDATRALREALQAKATSPLPTFAKANAAATTATHDPIADASKPTAGAASRDGEENAQLTEPQPPSIVAPPASQRPLLAQAAAPAQAAISGGVWPTPAAPSPSQQSASDKGDKLVPSAESVALQPSASDDAALEPILPGEPIAGAVPLPPHRPQTFAMAAAPTPRDVPLPRPRPANASPEPAPTSVIGRVPWTYDPGSIQ